MSTARAERFLLERLSSSQTVLVPLLLDLEEPLPGADGAVHGQSVVMVGAHALRQLPEGEAAVQAVLAALEMGTVPEGVLPVSYAPRASEGLVVALTGAGVSEVLYDGPRQTGKTQLEIGVAIAEAEWYARAGFSLPLLALWLHSSLISATTKTVPSLLEPMWGGCWSVREAGTVAVFTLGGIEMVRASFVPTDEQAGGERARAACHLVIVEEAVAGLHEGGINEKVYDLARNSMLRLPTPRRVAIVSTNPGALESWPFKRFIEPGRSGCVRIQIPAADRLTPEENRAQIESFSGTPDLQRRLALGEWCGLQLGQAVTPNFTPATHVAPRPLEIVRGGETWMAWDSGGGAHCHATVIAQHIGHEVRILAGLVTEEVGLDQHIQGTVLPWCSARMPWLLRRGPGGNDWLFHRYDPAMEPGEGGDIEYNGVRRVRDALGGHFYRGAGASDWAGRINPLLDLLNRGNNHGGMAAQFDPGADTLLLRRALQGEAYYGMTQNGTVARDKQHKPNHPFEDLLDAVCYLAGGVAPQLGRDRAAEQAKYQTPRYARTKNDPGGLGPRRAASGLS
jgi:hypothetical protein